MIQGISSYGNAYRSLTPMSASESISSLSVAAGTNQSVITIERGNNVYETYLRNGVVQKMQCVGSNLSKSF